jgi:hypothetical protein
MEQDPHAPRTKKQRMSRGANAGTTTPATLREMQAAVQFSILLYVAGVVLISVPIHTASQDTLSTIKDSILTLRDEAILPAIAVTLGSSEGMHFSEPSQLATAAALRLAYSFQGSILWRFDPQHTTGTNNLGRQAELLMTADETLPELRVELVSLSET